MRIGEFARQQRPVTTRLRVESKEATEKLPSQKALAVTPKSTATNFRYVSIGRDQRILYRCYMTFSSPTGTS